MDGVYSLTLHGKASREDFSLIYRQISQSVLVKGKEIYAAIGYLALTPPLFNTQFVAGENELILNGLKPVLGLGLPGIRPPGRN